MGLGVVISSHRILLQNTVTSNPSRDLGDTVTI